MIKAVIFDFGGVIAEVSMKRTCDKFSSMDVKRQDLWDAILEAYHYYAEGHGTLEDVRLTTSEKLGKELDPVIFKECFTTTGKYNDDVLALADSLRSNYKVFILSSNHKELVDVVKPKLIPHFDKMYFSNEVGVSKPNPCAYQMVLEENNLKPEECIFIDDHQPFIDAAKNLGIKTILFQNASQVKEDLKSMGIQV